MLYPVCQAETNNHLEDRALSEVGEELSILHHHKGSFQIWQRLNIVSVGNINLTIVNLFVLKYYNNKP